MNRGVRAALLGSRVMFWLPSLLIYISGYSILLYAISLLVRWWLLMRRSGVRGVGR